MASTYTDNAGFAKPALGDRTWNVPVNANADALDGMTAIGSLCAALNEVPSTSLILKVSAGVYRLLDDTTDLYAGGTITLDTSTTNYVWLDDSGVLTKGAAFPAATHLPIAVAVTDATTITTLADARVVHAMVTV